MFAWFVFSLCSIVISIVCMSCCFGIINNNNNNNKRRQAPSGSLDCRRVRCAGYLKRAAYESQYRRHCDVAVSRSSQRHHPSSDDDADECQCHVRLAIITTGCSAGDLLGAAWGTGRSGHRTSPGLRAAHYIAFRRHQQRCYCKVWRPLRRPRGLGPNCASEIRNTHRGSQRVQQPLQRALTGSSAVAEKARHVLTCAIIDYANVQRCCAVIHRVTVTY